MRKAVFEIVRTVLFALILAFVITALIKPTLVKGESMYPTIQPYNYLIVNKVPYFTGQPQNGDIIVFKVRIFSEGGEEKDLIKRIIGIPGDTLSIRDNTVYRNGEPLKEPYVNGGITPGEMEEVTVEVNHVFVMGDNRANSMDSRDISIGQIPYEDIMGRVDLRLYPFYEIGPVVSQ